MDLSTLPQERLSRARRCAVIWFVIGTLYALGIQYGWSHREDGNWTRLINTGENSVFRPWIEKDLGPVISTGGIGHDGQWTYLIARDPFGRGDFVQSEEVLKLHDVGYRWRRILPSFIAGAAGHLSGESTLLNLCLLASIGVGLSVGSCMWLLTIARGSILRILAVFCNPGIICGLTTLTTDPLALGLALSGLCFWLSGRSVFSIATFAAALLTKEAYILVPLGLAIYELLRGSGRRGFSLLVMSSVPLVIWSAYIALVLPRPEISHVGLNITWPFWGIVRSYPVWVTSPPQEAVFTAITLLSLILLVLVLCRGANRFMLSLSAPWLIFAVCLSPIIWELGNNSSRALMIIWLLLVVVSQLRLPVKS